MGAAFQDAFAAGTHLSTVLPVPVVAAVLNEVKYRLIMTSFTRWSGKHVEMLARMSVYLTAVCRLFTGPR